MKLSEFVEAALNDIALGVERAREKSRDMVAIAPSRVGGQIVDKSTYVDFDISIAVADPASGADSGSEPFRRELIVMTTAADGKRGLEGAGKTKALPLAVHRISFQVPVHMGAKFERRRPPTSLVR